MNMGEEAVRGFARPFGIPHWEMPFLYLSSV